MAPSDPGTPWTRRRFLNTSVSGPILAGSSASFLIPAIEPAQSAARESADALNQEQRELLRAAMDEIIPANKQMPSASGAGGLDYLSRLIAENPAVGNGLRQSLTALEESTRKQFNRAFHQLAHTERIAALTRFEQTQIWDFTTIRDFVYESYYTQPRIWKLIGYEFYPTDHPGPRMKPFDESILAKVRKKPKFYREV